MGFGLCSVWHTQNAHTEERLDRESTILNGSLAEFAEHLFGLKSLY